MLAIFRELLEHHKALGEWRSIEHWSHKENVGSQAPFSTLCRRVTGIKGVSSRLKGDVERRRLLAHHLLLLLKLVAATLDRHTDANLGLLL